MHCRAEHATLLSAGVIALGAVWVCVQCERQYVSTLADVIENTYTFRSLPGAALRVRRDFGAVD